MSDIWSKLAVVVGIIIILVSVFFIGADYQKWKTTDRIETFDHTSQLCEDIIMHDAYIKTHKEVNRGILLDDCIKYVMKEPPN
jgi:hypothetical protein